MDLWIISALAMLITMAGFWLAIVMFSTVDGWEDEHGFHYGIGGGSDRHGVGS